MNLVLTINAGSSSLKFGVFQADRTVLPVASGQVENLGEAARLVVEGKEPLDIGPADHETALRHVMDAIRTHIDSGTLIGIGHRIVHGGTAFEHPAVLDAATMQQLEQLVPLAPLHQPHNLACIRAAETLFPNALQVGCFDTAFHRSHPWVNDVFAIPRRYYELGVRRYGFHGLSYDYVTGVLKEQDPALHAGKVVIAHLGNGASMCAVNGGKSIASTMGFTALDGLPMGTRSGQVDPGVLLYLQDQLGHSTAELSDILYRKSGLLGLSGISSDMRALLASDHPHAAQAIEYYVFRVQREVGAMAASLGGINALVFTGGVGENADVIRERITENLGFLGIALDKTANRARQRDIGKGAVRVLVIPTNEEMVIARAVFDAAQAETPMATTHFRT